MRLVLATTGFATPGGSETYILVVAEQLERLGHEATIRASELGPIAEEAEGRGIRVVSAGQEPRRPPDAILVQDAPSAYELRDLWPDVPQVFRACSDFYDFQLPPALPHVVACVVVLSDRVGARIRAMGSEHEIVRLRHPVDTVRFSPLRSIRRRPRRALVLGNYLDGERLEALTAGWGAAGVECLRVGHPGARTLTPELAMNDADIVVGKARVVLEGMACGRAAYVYDYAGRDGWVTPERYPAMEADNFAGMATDLGLDPAALTAELSGYDSRMGDVNRDLALRHHHAARHAEALVALFERVASPVPAANAPVLDELARLGRRQWAAERTAMQLRWHLAHVTGERDDARAALARAEAELAQARDAAAAAADERERALLATWRVRAGFAMGRLADRVRGRE